MPNGIPSFVQKNTRILKASALRAEAAVFKRDRSFFSSSKARALAKARERSRATFTFVDFKSKGVDKSAAAFKSNVHFV